MPSRSGSSRAKARRLSSIVGVAVAYAVVRYNLFGGVRWSELPLYVSNKGMALGAAALLAVSYLANRRLPPDAEGREARRQLARTAGLAGFALSLIHVLTSFAILTEARYPLLFTRGELSGSGLVCLGSGALATALFAVPAVYSIQRLAGATGTEALRHAQHLGYVGLALTALHALAVGLPNWFAPSRWPGGLPPISMISFWVCLAPIGARLVAARLRGRIESNRGVSGP